MIQVIFTLDYEIHGNGDGNPKRLMVEPTDRLLRLFDEYGAKLTIMADVAEILKFKEYKDQYGRDDYCYEEIINQLRDAIKRGHDVQLHLHSSYFNAWHDGQRWVQDWSEYDFARLPYERMDWMVKVSKNYLETIIREINPTYRCIAFRAANWSVCPANNVARALINNGIKIDTSVFKYGQREGIVGFDYTHAHSQAEPWRVREDDFCVAGGGAELWEFPIYSENRWIGAFVTPNRLYRAIVEKAHSFPNLSEGKGDIRNKASKKCALVKWPLRKNAWKADFNQCGGYQLINALLRAEKRTEDNEDKKDSLFLLIGHSKLFNFWNEFSLRSFLKVVRRHSTRFAFDMLRTSTLLNSK